MIHLQFWAYGSWNSLFPIVHLQTYESRTLFLMKSLQYYCILGLAEIKTLLPRDKIMHKRCRMPCNKITEIGNSWLEKLCTQYTQCCILICTNGITLISDCFIFVPAHKCKTGGSSRTHKFIIWKNLRMCFRRRSSKGILLRYCFLWQVKVTY